MVCAQVSGSTRAEQRKQEEDRIEDLEHRGVSLKLPTVPVMVEKVKEAVPSTEGMTFVIVLLYLFDLFLKI